MMRFQQRVVTGMVLAAGLACTHHPIRSEGPSRRAIPLRNPGFREEGGIGGQMAGIALHWQTTDGKPHPGWYDLDRDVFRSPPSSQRLTYIPGVSDPWGTVWQFTPPDSVVPGGLYEAEVWCKVRDFEGASRLWGGLRLAIRFMADERSVLEEHRGPLDSCEDHHWERVSVRARAPEKASRIQMLLYHHTEAGTVWYDDAAVCRIAETEPGR